MINGAGSVFETEPAREWLRLLEAIERPASAARAHSAALTCFFGWTAEQLAAASIEDVEDVHQRLHDWARMLRAQRRRRADRADRRRRAAAGRVLAEPGGERHLTDLRHIGQLLHAEAQAEQLGTTALTAWLRRRIAEADDDTGDEQRSRRLESDAEAVQVLTIHRSKGLEFAIVYCRSCGSRATSRRARCRSSSTTPTRRPAHDRRRRSRARTTAAIRPSTCSSGAARTCASPTSR